MMGTIGVLCARIRVEEKQIAAALAEAGASMQPIQPAALPMPPAPPTPLPPAPALAGGLAGDIVIDRLQNRAVASAMTRSLRLHGATVIGAGLAASGDRLAVATALANAGVPRPACWFAPDDATALAAIEQAGYPATLLPLAYDSKPIILLDRDTAEAVTEHRMVLGSGVERVSLIQAGTNLAGAVIIVVGGRAVAAQTAEGATLPAAVIRVAEAAAVAVDADICGVQIIDGVQGPQVWDIDPAPDFRHASPIGSQSAAEAIAALATSRSAAHASDHATAMASANALLSTFACDREEIRGDVILTA
jgi:glutathione synthase/RimK-type ligase-like ATP-grasp enzyme